MRQGRAGHVAWSTVEEVDMTNAFIIEIQGRTAGIAVHDDKDFQFFASDSLFWTLENRRFRNLRQLRAMIDEQIEAHETRRKRSATRNTLLRRQQSATMEL
jgi:hypothetical protein